MDWISLWKVKPKYSSMYCNNTNCWMVRQERTNKGESKIKENNKIYNVNVILSVTIFSCVVTEVDAVAVVTLCYDLYVFKWESLFFFRCMCQLCASIKWQQIHRWEVKMQFDRLLEHNLNRITLTHTPVQIQRLLFRSVCFSWFSVAFSISNTSSVNLPVHIHLLYAID